MLFSTHHYRFRTEYSSDRVVEYIDRKKDPKTDMGRKYKDLSILLSHVKDVGELGSVQGAIERRMETIEANLRSGPALALSLGMIMVTLTVIVVAFPIIAAVTTFFATFAAIAVPIAALSVCGGIALMTHTLQRAKTDAQNDPEHQALERDHQTIEETRNKIEKTRVKNLYTYIDTHLTDNSST